ncbi:MAG: DUF1343 domain-containing protein [Rhodothermales bacterium]|nr:DUF1343 domain-containing protein [Rhodothermales bacterium]
MVHLQRASAILGIGIALGLSGCADSPRTLDAPSSTASPSPITTGADALAAADFDVLSGLRVGLISNHTARVGDAHLADLLAASDNVELVALFGPEHGIRGTADAGDVVGDSVDSSTGVPVYSLYGKNRAPTEEMLANVDVLLFDIQDIGARFYTYISTMGRSMQSAARYGKPFYVLDRPNPLSGEYVSGFVLDEEHRSFVGEYPIPVAHGMTVGELAVMIHREGMLPGLDSLELEVIPLQGWERSMQWPETGYDWIAPSPNIPSFETALVYPGACFVEATIASEGRGTLSPFLWIGAEWAGPLADELNARNLPGVRFESIQFTPRSIPGMSTRPKLLDKPLEGIGYQIEDRDAFLPVETGIHVLHGLMKAYAMSGGERSELIRESGMLRLAGTSRLTEMLVAGAEPQEIIDAWAGEIDSFRARRAPHLLYP